MTVYVAAAVGLLLFAYLAFRRVGRRSYHKHGRLTGIAASFQFLTILGVIAFPFLYNSSQYQWFWVLDTPAGRGWSTAGCAIIILGFAVAFGTMAWFGLRRAFGLGVMGLVRGGPYRLTRNPQVVGGYLLVIGSSLQWPSLYALGWIGLWGVVTHWMILTEEEHLRRQFGEEYARYCREVPNYIGYLMVKI
jgi:protein-S-isoprenylcysteine O-methyltransferase Ste14